LKLKDMEVGNHHGYFRQKEDKGDNSLDTNPN
jgi:hypothetical protein